MKDVLVAGLYHETHTFVPESLGLEDFKVFGASDLAALIGDGSPMDGVLEVGKRYGWNIHFAAYLRASPGGLVKREVLDFFLGSIRSCIRSLPRSSNGMPKLDGVYLVLHGAMVCDGVPDVEGCAIREVRHLVGADIPICGVLDLHANVSMNMVGENLGLVSYRRNPHTDSKEAAMDGGHLLESALNGTRIRSVLRHLPILWPATGLFTDSDPMCRLERLAREAEEQHDNIVFVNVNAGYSFADIEDAGVSFSAVTTGEPDHALEALEPLAAYALDNKQLGNRPDLSIEDVVRDILSGPPGLVVVAEPADNIGGGAPGDCTGMLRALLEHGVPESVITISDEETAGFLHDRQVGETCRVRLGGKGMEDDSPVEIDVELLKLTDGKTVLEDANSHLASMYGMYIDMGPSALVRHDGVYVIVTSRKMEPFDLSVFRYNGINPETMRCVVAKAAVAHKTAFMAIAERFLSVDTPGPCRTDLRNLPFEKIRRPIYPLDDI